MTSLSSTKVYLRPQCKRHIYSNVPEFQRYTGKECQLVTSQLCNPFPPSSQPPGLQNLALVPKGLPF